MTFLITGCSRGIGLELVRQALHSNYNVYAAVRTPSKCEDLNQLAKSNSQLKIIELDASSDASVLQASKSVESAIDVLINNAGVYLDSGANQLSELSMETVAATFQTNTIGPMRVTKAFSEHLSKSSNPRVINITSLMGSIKDNAGGGSYAYRMSKTALNMFTKTLSIEFPKWSVLCLHPGWVQTDMGGRGATVTPVESAKGIMKLALGPKQKGLFYDYSGRELPW